MSLAQSYTLADVTRWYSMQELQKAKAYLNSISRVEIRPDVIAALVQGSTRQPYAVEITFERDNAGDLAIKPLCSCPVRFKCKHSAAVLLSVLS
jgi:uncharacterized Zn finger protein